jgi:hypothetical protein
MSIVVTEGQRHDSTQLVAVLDGIRVPRPGGIGRPRKRPDHVLSTGRRPTLFRVAWPELVGYAGQRSAVRGGRDVAA